MNSYKKYFMRLINCALLLVLGCSMPEGPVNKSTPFGLITTPSSYYSTAKAKHLGHRYKENLDRLVERIVRNAKTSNIQFANNLAGVGGIGFFTHSATKTADERYLEIVLGVPETFPVDGDQSEKFQRLFSMYGKELLSILSSDLDIYQNSEVAGYGLNFSWRSVGPEPAAQRIILERAVVYLAKEKVRRFVRQEIDQNSLLGEAIVFAAREDSPLRLLSYRAPEPTPDYRPAVREETIVAKREVPTVAPKRIERSAPPPYPGKAPKSETTKEKEDITHSPAKEPQAQVRPSTPAAEAAPSMQQKKAGADSLPKPDKLAQVPATKAPLPGEPAPDSRAQKPAESVRSVEMNEREAESKTAIPEPAVKPALAHGQARKASGDSMAEAGRAKPSQPLAAAAEKVGEAKAFDNQSSRIIAEGTRALSSPSAAEYRQPAAKPAATKVDTTHEEPKPAATVAEKPRVNQPSEGLGRQAIALNTGSKSTALRPPPARSLEGYIIQLAFTEKIDAQRWAETLQGRGYAVSVTVPDGGGAIRVRLGNFSQREDAERQLQRLRQDGLSGIVLNLPRAHRPEVQPARGDGTSRLR